MAATRAPVETTAAQRPAEFAERREIDPEVLHFSPPAFRQSQLLVRPLKDTVAKQGVEQRDAQISSQVVVADPRLPQGGFLGTGANAGRTAGGRDAHQVLQQGRDTAVGQTVVAMPALRLHCDQIGLLQARQVRAAGLFGHSGFDRKLAGG